MSDSYVKDIVYDLIESKLKIKDLEYKLAKIEAENSKLIKENSDLTLEVSKWKGQIVAYINDYRNIYMNDGEKTVDHEEKIENYDDDVNELVYDVNKKNEIVNTIVEEPTSNNAKEIVIQTTTKTRNEYMKEYMKNKRIKAKEELKKNKS
jgi:hypothetical protein